VDLEKQELGDANVTLFQTSKHFAKNYRIYIYIYTYITFIYPYFITKVHDGRLIPLTEKLLAILFKILTSFINYFYFTTTNQKLLGVTLKKYSIYFEKNLNNIYLGVKTTVL